MTARAHKYTYNANTRSVRIVTGNSVQARADRERLAREADEHQRKLREDFYRREQERSAA